MNMSASWAQSLRHEADWDPLPGDDFTVDVLQAFLNGNKNAVQTAAELQERTTEITDLQGKTYNFILDIASKDPSRHNAITQLLIELGQGGNTTSMDAWKGLPGLGASINDEWNDVEVPTVGPERRRKIERWQNLSRFMAVVTLTGLPMLSLRRYAFWTLRQALEYPKTDLGAWVPAAAMWPTILGPELPKWTDAPNDVLHGKSGAAGPLWQGDRDFNLPRYRFWGARFREVSQLSDIGSDVCELAKAAADIIEG